MAFLAHENLSIYTNADTNGMWYNLRIKETIKMMEANYSKLISLLLAAFIKLSE